MDKLSSIKPYHCDFLQNMKLRTRIVLVYGTIFLFLTGSVIVAASFLINNSFDRVHYQDVDNLRNIINNDYKLLGERASNEVSKIVKANGAEIVHAITMVDTARDIWRQLSSGTNMDILELGDADGTIVASAHDPARFGITDKDALRIAKSRAKDPSLRIRSGNRLTVEYICPIPAKGKPLAFVVGGYYLKEQLKPIGAGADYIFLLQGNSPSVIYGSGVSIDDLKDKLIKLAQQTGSSPNNTPKTIAKTPVTPKVSQQQKSKPSEEKKSEMPRLLIGKKEYTIGVIPLMAGKNNQLGAIIAAFSEAPSNRIQMRLIRSLIGVAIAGIIAAYVAGYFISKSVTKPIQDLVDGVGVIAGGNLDHRIETDAQGEVKFLVDSVNDMTVSLKENRERAISAERIAAWQDVARTVAHEIKNPLWPIQSSIRSLRKAYQSDKESFEEIFDECTETIVEEVDSLRKIVDEFSQFARMPKPNLNECNINDVIADTLKLWTARPENVEIITSLAKTPIILGDKEQLSRAFINIITNAVQAMPNGGKLTISTSFNEQKLVCVTFADTGIGMTQEVKEKIFQPYFTTKESGTGLGMAVVHRVITDHKGVIEVESEENVGTKFIISFPTA
jgi:two-component system, NtrC family, nitrogen regulation sensor histidine kinase NtrY